MGNLCCWKRKRGKKIVLLLVGLDNAGKTVTAKGLAGEPADSVVPTVGFSVVRLRYKEYDVNVYDLGGGAGIRGIWHRYFVDAHGVIFVVDSSDLPRLAEAKLVLKDLLSHEQVSGKPVLLLANKQDQSEALDELDVVEQLELERLVNDNRCPTLVETCSAIETAGLQKGYDWLVSYVVRNYDSLSARIKADLEKEQLPQNGHIIHVRSAVPERSCRPKSAPVRKFQVADSSRPKSANQVVMDHLRSGSGRKRSRLLSCVANKTVPVALYQGGDRVQFVGNGDGAGDNNCLNDRIEVEDKWRNGVQAVNIITTTTLI